MASDIGFLINIAIVLVLYFGLDTIQSLVFDGETDVKPEPRVVQSTSPVRSHYRRSRPSFVTQRKYTPQRPIITIRRGNIEIPIASRSHYNIRTVEDVHKSDLHTRILQRNLARGIDSLFPDTRDEIESTLRTEASGYKTWTPVHVNSLSVRVVIKTLAQKCCTATPPKTELSILEDSLHEEMGCLSNVLHLFPITLSPFAKGLLPSHWRMYSNLSVAERLIALVIEERRVPISRSSNFKDHEFILEERLAVAAWAQNGPVNGLDNSALSSCLSLARQTPTPLNDFISSIRKHPQTVETLRGEVVKALREAVEFKSTTRNRLRRLENFLIESQRATHLFFSLP